MQYLITFAEGIISFISPCMLPMLPVYISYFAAGEHKGKKSRTFFRSLCFTAGFTVVFSLLGLFAGTVGSFLTRYRLAVNIVSGIIVIFFGLSYLDLVKLKFLKGVRHTVKVTGPFSAFLFGLIYAVSLTPCIGAFLGSALMLASASGTALRGVTLLIVYSLGLGLPFLLSSLLLEQLGTAFQFIKKHYKTVNLICGFFLIAVGLAMCFGLFNKLLSVFS